MRANFWSCPAVKKLVASPKLDSYALKRALSYGETLVRDYEFHLRSLEKKNLRDVTLVELSEIQCKE